jgi:hypothetical protein
MSGIGRVVADSTMHDAHVLDLETASLMKQLAAGIVVPRIEFLSR